MSFNGVEERGGKEGGRGVEERRGGRESGERQLRQSESVECELTRVGNGHRKNKWLPLSCMKLRSRGSAQGYLTQHSILTYHCSTVNENPCVGVSVSLSGLSAFLIITHSLLLSVSPPPFCLLRPAVPGPGLSPLLLRTRVFLFTRLPVNCLPITLMCQCGSACLRLRVR